MCKHHPKLRYILILLCAKLPRSLFGIYKCYYQCDKCITCLISLSLSFLPTSKIDLHGVMSGPSSYFKRKQIKLLLCRESDRCRQMRVKRKDILKVRVCTSLLLPSKGRAPTLLCRGSLIGSLNVSTLPCKLQATKTDCLNMDQHSTELLRAALPLQNVD